VLRNPGALVSLARLKTQDDYTYMHSVAVCALMVALGAPAGPDEDDCREAGMAGLLHDLGKAMMPLDVLNKPGKLTDGEFASCAAIPSAATTCWWKGRGASEAIARRLPAPP
jgi:HD-GYP domain-containing protein (c-di-GMP phosphodiesterase class II)